jgi:hypothetical protein
LIANAAAAEEHEMILNIFASISVKKTLLSILILSGDNILQFAADFTI